MQEFESPPETAVSDEEAAVPYGGRTQIETEAQRIRRKHERSLLAIDGVNGVGISRTPIGNDAIVVYVRDRSVKDKIPETLDGIPVVVEIVGEFDALRP